MRVVKWNSRPPGRQTGIQMLGRQRARTTRRWLQLGFLIFSLGLAACTATNDRVLEDARSPVTPTSESLPERQETATRLPESKYENLEIVTLLPRDAIPAIDSPQFLKAAEADRFYDPDELVMGVTFNGDARAYSVPFLSNHEIVNDTVGGVKIAVTW